MGASPYVLNIREKIGHDLLMMTGVSGVVLNEAGEVLLQLRSDNHQWSLPGGGIDPGEEPADAVVREIWEETGIKVRPERVLSVQSGPDHFVTYTNGDQGVFVMIIFLCTPIGGDLQPQDDESLEVRYFPTHALPPLHERHSARIALALQNRPRAYFERSSDKPYLKGK
jgi:8-oxo-dGTP diphosphatase